MLSICRSGVRPISLLTLWVSGGLDSSIILILRGGIPRRPVGDFPEGLSQAMLVGVTLVIREIGRIPRCALWGRRVLQVARLVPGCYYYISIVNVIVFVMNTNYYELLWIGVMLVGRSGVRPRSRDTDRACTRRMSQVCNYDIYIYIYVYRERERDIHNHVASM